MALDVSFLTHGHIISLRLATQTRVNKIRRQVITLEENLLIAQGTAHFTDFRPRVLNKHISKDKLIRRD